MNEPERIRIENEIYQVHKFILDDEFGFYCWSDWNSAYDKLIGRCREGDRILLIVEHVERRTRRHMFRADEITEHRRIAHYDEASAVRWKLP